MKHWLCITPTGVDDLVWQTASKPPLQPHEVRVAIHAASLNFPDLLIVQGRYQIKPELPFVPGAEWAGVVEAVGAAVTELQIGQRVACLSGTGAFATHATVAASECLALPDNVPLEEAAAFIMTYATSHHALLDRGQLRPGETVLILGGAGGVGTAAIQIAKAAGARVIAAASTEDKCDFCQELGADATLNYSHPDWRQRIKALTDGKGPDVVYDAVGGEWAEPAFRSIAWRGRYLVVGFASGEIPRLPLNLALLKGASVVGVFWGEFSHREPAANQTMMKDLTRWWSQGQLRPVIDRTWPMTELAAAYAHMSTRGVKGKVVLLNQPISCAI